ncbi:elongator complex protein 6 [Palaemon carinicauda]|uniref:elongator complex protein 6 n=1 Tax=Palaemon carinicauda TaxID=392227 RepID=UPI0035B6791B
MFDSVKNALEGGGVSIAEGGVFLISESPTTSASGLVSHFLSFGVTNNSHVCFVSLQHTWGHYCNIGNKCGMNLRQQATEGKVKVIEGLKLMSEVINEDFQDANHPFSFMLEPSKQPLRNLYNIILETVESWRENKEHFVLIIDGVSSLLNLGVLSSEIEIFLNYCRTLIEGDDGCKYAGVLIIVTKSYGRDEDTVHLVNRLAQCSAVHMSLEALSTGFSREVHGNLRLIFNHASPHLSLPDVQLFQYKMEDKNIRLFAPGTSAGVL